MMKIINSSDIKNEINLIKDLVNNDLKARYSGSVFGIIWAFVQPLVNILVFWYVFQIGFKNPPVDDVEFILWLIAGFIPWTFFSDAVNMSANVFYEYTFLVKKMKFQVWLLPIVKAISCFVIHLFFIVFVICMYLLYGYEPKLSWLNVFYYSFCLFVNVIGLSYITSSVSVLFKDTGQLVGIILQLGFWMTPIFWSGASMKEEILRILKLNPLYYVIDGNREALINHVWFFRRSWQLTAYYWGITIIILIVGVITYRKLREHFADLL